MKKYAVSYGRGPNLAEVEIEKETPKTYVVRNRRLILGYLYFGKRTPKRKFRLFDSLEQAVEWLISAHNQRIEAYTKSKEEQLQRIQVVLKENAAWRTEA